MPARVYTSVSGAGWFASLANEVMMPSAPLTRSTKACSLAVSLKSALVPLLAAKALVSRVRLLLSTPVMPSRAKSAGVSAGSGAMPTGSSSNRLTTDESAASSAGLSACAGLRCCTTLLSRFRPLSPVAVLNAIWPKPTPMRW